MRLITRKIYRAFPELDRFTDEQCERFVDAAQRGWVRKLLHWALVVVTALVFMFASFALMALFVQGLEKLFGRDWAVIGGNDVPVALIGLLIICAGPFLGAIMSDRLLLRRVRHVLRTRGVCAACRYVLIGLPVSGTNVVTCPECAFETEVDPALGELVLDSEGKATFEPSASAMPKPPRFFTPRRVKTFKRVAAWTAIILLIVLPGGFGLWEWRIRAQAAQARAERPGLTKLMEHVESAQPVPAGEGVADAWVVFMEATQQRLSIEAAHETRRLAALDAQQLPTAERNAWADARADFLLLLGRAGVDRDPEMMARDERSEKLARDLLMEYRAGGLFEKMNEIAAAPRAVRRASITPNQPMVMLLLPDLGQSRQMARINAARMHLAAEQGDWKEFLRAFEVNMALSRISEKQFTLIEGLVGIAIEAMSYGQVRFALSMHPPAEVLEGIEAVLARQPVTPDATFALDGERLVAMDTVAWTFSDPGRTRFGRFSPGAGSVTGASPMMGALGSYEQNRDEFNRIFEEYKKAALVPWKDRVDPGSNIDTNSLVLVKTLMPALSKAIKSFDRIQLERRGLAVMIALEKYRTSRGEYPETLIGLVPEYLSAIPIDDWSLGPLAYRRIDAASDPNGRGYLLYSVGVDGENDGGATHRSDRVVYEVLSGGDPRTSTGFDFIINDPRR